MSDVQTRSAAVSPSSNGAVSPDEERAVQIEKNKGLIALLESWLAAPDVEEQQEALDTLMRALDEDRLSDRKLFPWFAES
jgi:hypothetical protein